MINEHENVSDSARLNWESLFSLVELAPFGLYIIDSDFRIALMNGESKKHAFRNVNPVIGRDFAEAIRILWPEAVAAFVISKFRTTLDSGEPFFSVDYIEPRADIDAVEAYEWELHRITLPDGRYGVVCYFYDSTKVRESEQALLRNETWLKGQKEAFLASINGAPLETSLDMLIRCATNFMGDGGRASFFLLKPDGKTINHITGMGDEYTKVIGDFPVGPDSIGCGLAAHIGTPLIYSDVDTDPDWESYLWLARRFDFRATWSFPVRVAGGKIVGTFCMYYQQPRDVTPRDLEVASTLTNAAAVIMVHHLAMQERIRTEQVLREADHRKNEFLALLAHELRNPLAAIRNAGQILLRANGDAQTSRLAAEILNRQVDHMVRQVDDLLDVNRITQGKIELRKENTALTKIISHAVETSRSQFDELEQEFIVTLHTDPIYIYGDPIRLTQVIGNLLNNASKFSGKGGKIWLMVEHDNDLVSVRIRDNGIGIDKADLQQIFEMFVQLDKSLERTRNGLGLGLALVKSLVDMHDGSVEAHSEGLGFGSEFIVRLPVLSGQFSVSSQVQNSPAQKNAGPLRILIADDNRDSAISLAALLELIGHSVAVAHDGLDAIEKAASFYPDLILLDIGMPEVNGYEAARRIRKTRKDNFKLVALTGMSQEKDRRLSLEAGFDAHLIKPVDLSALAEFLARD
ncbi:ATP-binding protein [Cellvibrio mixtus]|uniref:ATP-binding protein n=1 Tax=Cellvibrio mixtus TaxID=39650 RepID=UPI00069486A0|nr:ATP-binding protein [Cellvibrio mixtus]